MMEVYGTFTDYYINVCLSHKTSQNNQAKGKMFISVFLSCQVK